MMRPGMNPTNTSNRMRKTIVAPESFDGPHMCHNGRTSRRMLRKVVQQGRSEQRGEEVQTTLRVSRSPFP